MTKPVRVSDYTYELAQEIINRGMAHTFPEALDKALANYLGIRYKSDKERKMESDTAQIMSMGESIKRGE